MARPKKSKIPYLPSKAPFPLKDKNSRIPYFVHRFPFPKIRQGQAPLMEVSDVDTYSPSNKRRRIQVESSGWFNLESDSDSETLESKFQEKDANFRMDSRKKSQCFRNLKKVTKHLDQNGFYEDFRLGSTIPQLHLIDIIKFKLEKEKYFETDDYVSDIRKMFSDTIHSYPLKHKMHKIAKHLPEIYEKNWKSFKERWETEKLEQEEDSNMQISNMVKN